MTFKKEDGLVQKLALLNYELTHYVNGLFTSPHINASNYFYLLKLLDYPEITQSAFSAVVKLNQSTITRAINALMENGYIEKLAAPDKRSALLRLTTLGRETAMEIKAQIDQLNADLQVGQDGQIRPLLEEVQVRLEKLAK